MLRLPIASFSALVSHARERAFRITVRPELDLKQSGFVLMWIQWSLITAFVVILAPIAGAQTSVTGTCVINTAVYRAASNTELVGDTPGFIDMPGVTAQFVQGGTSNGCVIVTFSAESFAPVGFGMTVRPVLDVSGRSVPADMQFAANDPDLYTARTAVFIFRNVTPGSHTVRMQFRAHSTERTEIGSYSLVVQYRR